MEQTRGIRSVGFTLIELLVVLGIIALLVGILLPVLGRVRDTSRGSACLNNLRQMMLGVETFTHENDGLYPERLPDGPAPTASLNDPTYQLASAGGLEEIPLPPLAKARPRVWQVAAYSRLRQIEVSFAVYQNDYKSFETPTPFVCPSDPDPAGPDDAAYAWWQRLPRSYLFNGFNDYKSTAGAWVEARDKHAVPRDQLVTPSATAVFGEKLPEPQYRTRFYVDIFRATGYPLQGLQQVMHDAASQYAFADGSARTYPIWQTLSPENLWAFNPQIRRDSTYSYDMHRDQK